MPIELAQPRVFAFEERKRQFTLTLKPITAKMWLKYFSGIISTQETINGNIESSFDSSGARLELLGSALINATGYAAPGTSLPEGWQGKLPIAHRKSAGDLLTDVAVDDTIIDDPDSYPVLGLETVTLKSVWTANDQGKMQQLVGLKHHFNSPSADHQKRYSRAMSRSVVVGGSRTGKTRWLGAQDVLIGIYDELIDSVEGYVFNGEPLAGEAIKAQMDSYHKVAAATVLFTAVDVPEEEAK